MTISTTEKPEHLKQAERDLDVLRQSYVMVLKLVTDEINAFIADTETERKADVQRQALKFRRNINRDIKMRGRLERLKAMMPTLGPECDAVLQLVAEAERNHEKALRIALKIAETAEVRPPDGLILNVSGLVGHAWRYRKMLAGYDIQRQQIGMFKRKMARVTERELDAREGSFAGDRERVVGSLRILESWKATLKPQFVDAVAEAERTLRETLKVLDEVEVSIKAVRPLTVEAEIAARMDALIGAA